MEAATLEVARMEAVGEDKDLSMMLDGATQVLSVAGARSHLATTEAGTREAPKGWKSSGIIQTSLSTLSGSLSAMFERESFNWDDNKERKHVKKALKHRGKPICTRCNNISEP